MLTAVIDKRAEGWKEWEKEYQIFATAKYFKDNMELGIISIIITVVLFVWGLSGENI